MNPGIGFIGSGFAQKVQAPVLKALGANLVGAASPNNAQAFSEIFNMPFHTSDWKELIKRDEVDLICITSPPYLHFEQVMHALEKGKNILCEKPFTLTVNEAEQLVRAAKDSNSMLLIDHELRFNPAVKFLKNYIEKGNIGTIYFTTINFHYSGRRNENSPYTWWYDKSLGGGTWGAIGSHMIDLVHFLIGDIKTSQTLLKTAIKSRIDNKGNHKECTSDEVAMSELRFENGAAGNIFMSVVSSQTSFMIEITGSKGSIRMDEDQRIWISEGSDYTELQLNLTPEEKHLNDLHQSAGIKGTSLFSRSFIHYADAIIRSLKGDKTALDNAATFYDGLKVQRILEEGYNQNKN